MQDLQLSIDKQYSQEPKFSSEWLKCKDAERKLIKQEDYLQANVMKKKAEALEKKERLEYSRQKEFSLKIRTTDLKSKQDLEKENFKKKIKLELEIFERQKLKSFEELIHRYKNRRLELEMSQKQEKANFFNSSAIKKSMFQHNF